MNAYTSIILALICEVVAHIELEYYDVGTVLFSPSDLNKKRWTTAEIALLEARKSFLDVLPPPNILLESQNEDFPNIMLDYFRDAYSVVKKNAKDDESNSLMKTALSDTIGGYMKMWILPITKFAYYGGTVPQDDALRLFQLHDDIKKYLNTEGKGWSKPRANFISLIPVNVAPLHTSNRRNAPDPCANLAYFEKTDKGLAIPVPNVNWEKDSESMFVPLKNQSLISLNSPNSSQTLFKYYNTAKNCLQTSNIEDHHKFDERLQNWLVVDVIPHLSDEKLYPALRSVLSLVNKTRNLCDTVIDLYTTPIPSSKRTCIAGIPIDLSSKKMMVITVIILLEIAWCIPTLCYLMCTKMKKKSNKNNVYFFIEPKNTHAKGWAESTQCTPVTNNTRAVSKEVSAAPSKRSTGFVLTPRTRSYYTETQFSKMSEHSMGTGTRSNFICQLAPKSMEMFDHATSLRSSSKKLTTSLANITPEKKASISFHNSNRLEDFCMIPDRETGSKTASFITVQELQPTKTVTVLHESAQRVKSGHGIKNLEIVNYVDETKKVDKKNTIKKKCKGSKKCALISSTDDCKRRPNTATTKLGNEVAESISVFRKHSDHHEMRKSKRMDPQKDLNVKSFKKGVRVSSGKPFLEITIDRPQREICVDISNPIKIAKPSKIPKRFFTNTVTQTHCSSSKREQPGLCLQSQSYRKSLIPQPKKQGTVDDIIIQSVRPSNDKRLNVTL